MLCSEIGYNRKSIFREITGKTCEERQTMKPDELEAVRRAIYYIKIARQSSYMTFNAMMASERLEGEVLEPLEKICGWGEEDEKEVDRLAQIWREETNGMTLQEKRERLSRILKIGGATAAGIGIVGVAASFFFRKKKNAEK